MSIPLLPRPKPPAGQGRPGGIQRFVRQIDTGVGATILKLSLFVLLVFFLMLLYSATQFSGLHEPEAMDLAQVGRNMAQGKGRVTYFIRPISVWYMEKEHREKNAQIERHPDLFNAPFYPMMLSLGFRLIDREGEVYGALADRVVMVTSMIWILPSLLLVYLLAREWFDRRVAMLSLWAFFLSNGIYAWGVTGTPTTFLMFLFLAAVYFLVKAARAHETNPFAAFWPGLYLMIAAACLAIGMLTRYSFGICLLGTAVFVIAVFKIRRSVYLTLFLAMFLVPVSLWMLQQMRISGKPFGLATYSIIAGTYSLEGNQLMRLYDDEVVRAKIKKTGLRIIAAKVISQMGKVLEDNLKKIGGSFVVVFFLVALLHPFRRRDVAVFLYSLVLLLVLGLLTCALTDGSAGGLMQVFYPVICIFGVAFFWILFDRLAPEARWKQAVLVLLFVLVNASTLVVTVLPPNPASPYPILKPTNVRGTLTTPAEVINRSFLPTETVASDIPWAVAWFASRRSLWTPWTLKEFLSIHDTVPEVRLNGLYLTEFSWTDNQTEAVFGETKFTAIDWPADIQRPWAAMAMGIPYAQRAREGFPLRSVYPFDFSNILYTDRERFQAFTRPPSP